MWLLRDTQAAASISLRVLLSIPLAAIIYVLALVALGTFRQRDMALVMELLPARLRKRLPFLTPRS